MDADFDLVTEQPKQLTGREERALLQRAVEQGAVPAVRLRLAELHNLLDAFGDTIALLGDGARPPNFATAKALADAHLGRGEPGDAATALAIARDAEALAPSDTARAAALAMQARALTAGGSDAEAEQAFSAALGCDPHNFEALRGLCAAWLTQGEPQRVLAVCDAVAAKGAAHAQLLGMRTLGLAQSGAIAAARASAGLDRFVAETIPPTPTGWRDLAAFHAALTEELLSSPGLRNGRHGTASIASLRVDEPVRAATPAMRALQQLIVAQVRDAVTSMPQDDHPWLAQRPHAAMLRMWCVMTGAEGFERWHMHPAGWASGGYYVAVPDSVARGNSAAGCLELGVPERFVGDAVAEAFGTRLVRPQAGVLTLFPSHTYHRTHPHGADSQRICIAFDVIPQ